MRLIDADVLYERACELEAQALDYVGTLNERDGDEFSTEWKIWSAILTERTAFKHDVFDSSTVDAIPVEWIKQWNDSAWRDNSAMHGWFDRMLWGWEK